MRPPPPFLFHRSLGLVISQARALSTLSRAQRERDARRVPKRSRRRRSEARKAARPAARGAAPQDTAAPAHTARRAPTPIPRFSPTHKPVPYALASPHVPCHKWARVRDAALSRGWHLNLPPILRVTDEPNATCAPHARRAIATPEKTQRAPVCHSHDESRSANAGGPRRHAASVWKGC